MTELPDPLTPSYCDLRGFDYMPFFGDRFFSSEIYDLALENPRAGWAALKLWWTAWQDQCPAGSLPNNDRHLARAADFGGDVKAWLKVKQIALRGFVLCSDGRLYHPLLSEHAVERYEGRIKHCSRRESDRERLKRWREQKRQEKAEDAQKQSDTGQETPDDTFTETRTETEHPFEETRHETPPETPPETPTETRFILRKSTGEESTGKEREESQLATSDSVLAREGQDSAVETKAEPHRPDSPAVRLSDPEWRFGEITGQMGTDGVSARRFATAGPFGSRRCVTFKPICAKVIDAAKMNASQPWDWDVVARWINDGLDAHNVILPAIRQCASRQKYRQPGTLRYFDGPVRDYARLHGSGQAA